MARCFGCLWVFAQLGQPARVCVSGAGIKDRCAVLVQLAEGCSDSNSFGPTAGSHVLADLGGFGLWGSAFHIGWFLRSVGL